MPPFRMLAFGVWAMILGLQHITVGRNVFDNAMFFFSACGIDS